jgi:hypothetical protein
MVDPMMLLEMFKLNPILSNTLRVQCYFPWGTLVCSVTPALKKNFPGGFVTPAKLEVGLRQNTGCSHVPRTLELREKFRDSEGEPKKSVD